MNLTEPAVGLPPTAEVLWKKTSEMPALAAFQSWAADFTAKPSAEKIAEGVKAATKRRAEMKKLISSDPEAALAATVPVAVRRKMPPEVQALLEERIDARGDYFTMAVAYGEEGLAGNDPIVMTQVTLSDGRRFRAHTFGRREYQPTRRAVPVHGIALDEHMAVMELPGRVMEPIELMEAKAALDGDVLCPVSEVPTTSTGTETGLLIADEAEIYCSPQHAEAELYAGADAEAMKAPGVRVAASGDDASLEADSPFRAPQGVSTGEKRLLVARINFPANEDDTSAEGLNRHQLSAGDCTEIVKRIGDLFKLWSYGRLTVKPVGSGGSGVTPMLLMTDPAKDYYRSDWYHMVTEVLNRAEQHGYHEENFDMLLILAGDAPMVDDVKDPDNPTTATYGGLGTIGGLGSLVRINDPAWTVEERINENVRVAMHELGHNFGLLHASSLYRLPAGSQYTFGKREYGDGYDTMGTGTEYNARYKHWLRWLDNANMHFINGSGVFTMREYDLGDKNGIRGLQLKVGTTEERTDVFVEYSLSRVDPVSGVPNVQWDHQQMAYGAMIRLGRSYAPKTFLMDSTEETPGDDGGDGVTDSPLLPGRTFRTSRPNGQNLWITNLNADPEAGELTVDVRYGTPAGNRSPVASVTTANGNAAGQDSPVMLVCNASDPDGDALSYHWIVPAANPDDRPWNRAVFPDENSILVTFPERGTQSVTCIVSDRHGGEVWNTMNLAVGFNESPKISSIPDITIDEDESVTVSFTVSDPSTPAEALIVSGTQKDGGSFPDATYAFSGTGENRSVKITPGANRFGKAEIIISASDGDLIGTESFILTVRPQAPGTVVSAFRESGWRYSATGISPPDRFRQSWMQSGYDDSDWAVDDAAFVHPYVLGSTSLGEVPGRLACYFRRQFSVSPFISGVPMVRLMCDDGAVVYINGVEAFRHNMPAGIITSDTYAIESVEGTRERQVHIFPVDPALILPGQINTIAVEVHDAANVRGANDVLFDLDLSFRQPPTLSAIADTTSVEDNGTVQRVFTAHDSEPGGGTLTFSFISSDPVNLPPDSISVFLQPNGTGLISFPSPKNPGVVQLTLRASDGLSETWRSFTHTTTPVDDPPQLADMPNHYAVLGQTPILIKLPLTDPDTPLKDIPISFNSTDKTLVTNAGIKRVFGDEQNPLWLSIQPVPGQTGRTYIHVTVSHPEGSIARSLELWIKSAPNAIATPAALIPRKSQWLMWADALPGGDKPIDFTDENLDDSTWSAVTTPVEDAIPTAPPRVTNYFRRSFEAGTSAGLSNVSLGLRCDDGAAVYINGSLVAHHNLPAGTLEASTLAIKEATEPEEATWLHFNLSPGVLQPGRNVIAVEIHQSHLPTLESSGDPLFDLELHAMPDSAASDLPTDSLIAPGSSWAYWDYPVDHAADALATRNWTQEAYETASVWKTGSAPLGYGTGIEATTINRFQDSPGADSMTTIPSALFRHTFHVPDAAALGALHLFLQRDDAATVYLNGHRVLLDNLAPQNNLPTARALAPADVETRSQWRHSVINPARLRSGTNTLAISIHQHPSTEDTLHFDLQLIAQKASVMPKVDLQIEPGGFLNLEWSSAYPGATLETSTNLIDWTPVTNLPSLTGPRMSLQLPKIGPNAFYRLVQP